MTARPIRIQRLRAKGFRLQARSPDGRPVIYVGRPSRWGNRWTPKAYWAAGYTGDMSDAIAACVEAYESWLNGSPHWAHSIPLPGPPDIAPLRGAHLACWCPLGQPCHADVLLELANA